MNEEAKKVLAKFMDARSPDESHKAAAWQAIDERIASGDMGPPLPEEVGASGGSGVLAAKIGLGAALVVALGYLAWPDAPAPSTAAHHEGTPLETPKSAGEAAAGETSVEPTPPPSGPPSVVPPPKAETPKAPPPPSAVAEDKPESSRKRTPGTPSKPHPDPAPTSSDLAEEMRLMRKGQSALAGDNHARALSAFDEHARRFPNGVLRDERRVRRAEALCGLGRHADARAAAQAFVRDSPSSPLAGKAARTCKEDE